MEIDQPERTPPQSGGSETAAGTNLRFCVLGIQKVASRIPRGVAGSRLVASATKICVLALRVCADRSLFSVGLSPEMAHGVRNSFAGLPEPPANFLRLRWPMLDSASRLTRRDGQRSKQVFRRETEHGSRAKQFPIPDCVNHAASKLLRTAETTF